MAKFPNIEQLLQEMRGKEGGSRQTVVRVLGSKLDRNGSPFHKEHVAFEDEADGPRTVDIVETGTCSFGHAIDEKTRVVGICGIGNEVVCSMPWCTLQCVSCGTVVCRKHSKTYGEKTYCSNCRWVYWWRRFWCLD